MNRNSKTFKIAMGGICLALAVIFMFGATIVPGVELTLFAISSLFTAVMILETGGNTSSVGTAEKPGPHAGVGGALLVFAGASILGFILIPNKLALIPYVALFGYYPILKFYIEKVGSGIIQIILKAVYFAAAPCLALLCFKTVIAQSIHMPDYPVAVLIIGGIVLLMLYDFVMTFLINWYIRRFKTGNEANYKLS